MTFRLNILISDAADDDYTRPDLRPVDTVWRSLDLQLGQASVNTPDLCLNWGDFNFAGSHAWEAEVPTLQSSKKGDSSFPGIVACKVEVPPTSSTSLGGSRWADLAVSNKVKTDFDGNIF